MCTSGLQRHVPACATHRGPELEIETWPSRVEQAKKSQHAHMTEHSTKKQLPTITANAMDESHNVDVENPDTEVGILEDSA